MIYYFAPYDERGLVPAYNRHCALVPNSDDWICVTDVDVLFFSSQRQGEHLASVIRRHHPKFSAFTCVASRAPRGCNQQQAEGTRDERDLVKLKAHADRHLALYPDTVTECGGPFSGHVMVFPKWLWEKVPFTEVPPNRSYGGHPISGIDVDWARRVKEAGHKIGVIRGLMAVHFFRFDDPTEHSGHFPGGLEWEQRKPVRMTHSGPPWRFVKLHGVAQTLTLADGTPFKFPLLRRADGAGFEGSSVFLTSDKALAGQLRTLAASPANGIVETFFDS